MDPEDLQQNRKLTPSSESIGDNPINPHLVDGKYSIKDLVDIEKLKSLFEEFSAATGFTTGFVSYPDQEILIATGWRDMCTKFHRACPDSEKHCKESNVYLSDRLKQMKALNIKPCENGLVDGATPVIIKGKHLASLFTGQVFFEKPDVEEFKAQAAKYGYDVDTYMKAMVGVPVISEKRMKTALVFLSGIAVMIAEQGLVNFRLKENAEKLEQEKSERISAEEAVHRQSAAIEQSVDGIAIADLSGNLLSVNSAWASMHHFDSADELLGRHLSIFHSEDQLRDEVIPFNEIVRREGGHKGEIGHVTRDGYSFQTMMTTTLLRDDHGKPIGMVGTARDITEELERDAKLRQAQKMESVGRLAGGVAHDFNNWLTPIIGYSDMLISDLPGDSPLKDPLEQIRESAMRARTVTQQLLAFSRKQVLEFRIVNLNRILSEFERILKRMITEDISIRFEKAPSLGNIKADISQIEQIIINLAVNAQDSMPHGGTLIFETKKIDVDEVFAQTYEGIQTGSYVMLAVSDTGTGMDEETLKNSFEPFFTTKETGKGTGLGLATVHGIVKQHGGHISVYSQPDQGTSFKIYFPLTEQAEEPAASAPTQQPDLKGSETLMVVEDNEMVRKAVCNILAEYGYDIIVAESPTHALSLAGRREQPIHLLLTDVVMPEMTGMELYKRIRTMRDDLKVLYMSGYSSNQVAERGCLDPEERLIQKPFTLQSLLSEIRISLKD